MERSAANGRVKYGTGRAALLDAAITVVANHGLRGLTLRAVAAEAGVSHGLVRHHFGTRDALVEATLSRSTELAIDSSSLEPGTGRLDEIAAGLAALVESQREVLAFQYELMLEARRRPELQPHVERMYDDFVAALQRELDRAGLGDDPDVARVMFAALDGLSLQQVIFGHPERTSAGVDIVHRLLTELLAARRRANA
jgi:AcrR family transcriptional regulator